MKTILVLDAVTPMRNVFATLLRLAGYTVLEAVSAKEALRIQKQHPGQIDLLITGVLLEGVCSGTQTALELRAVIPALKILFTSDTPMDQWRESDWQNVWELPLDSYSFLAKPFTRGELERNVRAVLAGADPTESQRSAGPTIYS